MDAYGCFHVTEDDARTVREVLTEAGAVVFALTGDDMGAMVITLTADFVKLGILPFGGRPDGRIYFGLYGRGCNHFAPHHTDASYFEEKLGLPNSDAETIAAFWNLMWKEAVCPTATDPA